MEKKFIYIVKGNFGSWDDAHTRNLKAFSNIDEAESYKKKATDVLKRVSQYVDKVDNMLSKEVPKGVDIEKFWDEQERKMESNEYLQAMRIQYIHDNLSEFQECDIEKLEII